MSWSVVGIALKTHLYSNLPSPCLDFLDTFPVREVASEGYLFYDDHIRWYDTNPNVAELYDTLRKCLPQDFLVLEGCYDYPTQDWGDGDEGDWHSNPWEMDKIATVTIAYTRESAMDHRELE